MVRVLIADDEHMLALALRTQLELRNCQVVGIAGDGKEAVELCGLERPDVVLMDIRMPGTDGVEATRVIMGKHPTCVVMLTGAGQPGEVAASEEAGAMAYLVKPVNADQILPAIEVARRRFSEFLALHKEVVELQEALATRKLVERAKGLLMDRAKLSEAEAFRRLQKLAMDQRLPLKDVAQRVVGTAEAADQLFGS
jgi:AmiR/NasT family two-component response regulator